MIHRSHPPRREGRFLLSPLTRRTDDGRFTASLSIRSGHGQGTCDRVYRFAPSFRSHAAGARYALAQGLSLLERPDLPA